MVLKGMRLIDLKKKIQANYYINKNKKKQIEYIINEKGKED
jgi:hypothetical protein